MAHKSSILFVALLAQSLAGCDVRRPSTDEGTGRPEALLLSAPVEQAADDLFHIVAQVHTEYEVVFTTAAFPDDTAKSTARKWYRARELDWELLRCVYGDMKYYRTLSEAANFLHRSRFFVDVPASGLSNWKREPYANLTKLEGLNDEYWIQAIKFGRLLSDQFHSSTDTTAARSRTGRL